MKYPKFIESGDTIGITAPSNGITDEIKLKQLDYSLQNLKNKLNVNIIETDNVRKSIKGKSSSEEERINQLTSLFLNDEVKLILSAAGGDFLYEILENLDYEIIKNNPKWIQGYSDPTGLLYTITTKCDIATLYGNNAAGFGMKNLHKSLLDNFEIFKGNIIEQESFDKFESMHVDKIIGNEEYVLDKEVKWINAFEKDEVNFKGRLIGGCFECLDLIFGTKHDNTKEFIKKYKDDGLVWYFDVFNTQLEDLMNKLIKYKREGYFNYTTGIIFGRMMQEISYNDYTFLDAVESALKDLNIPIIINADVGHVSPRMTFINGAIVNVTSGNGSGKIKFELK